MAAFFDLDDTLLCDNSGRLWAKAMFESGRFSAADLALTAYTLVLHKLALLDPEKTAARALQMVRGHVEQEFIDECDQWFDDYVRPRISADAMEQVRWHRRRGDKIYLLSASTPYVCAPVCRWLELDGYLCTRLEVGADGRFTGRIIPPMCYGDGKRSQMEQFAREEGINLLSSFFYSDSLSDITALEAVGHPVAVNADPFLFREAVKRGWALMKFARPGEAWPVPK
ncbi:MAG: HAD family hydrolase [Deltaproteobacteria bacterium]|nr:HAD family hydrolase [Deltaproteobacteria bacterium]